MDYEDHFYLNHHKKKKQNNTQCTKVWSIQKPCPFYVLERINNDQKADIIECTNLALIEGEGQGYNFIKM